MYELILVSQSPRRRQILEDAGFKFRVDTVKISEIIEENVNLAQGIVNIACTKVDAFEQHHKQLKGQMILLLSADTMVCFDQRPYGKPKNSTEAQHFLRKFSGKTHEVTTGVCLKNLKTSETLTLHSTTKVQLNILSEEQIANYVATGDPMDKAGGYGIQTVLNNFVQKIEGSYLNVMGFPLEEFEKLLSQKAWHVPRRKL